MRIKTLRCVWSIALCLELAACGGGSGGTSSPPETTTEAINGIQVPVEPTPATRDATVAGVDANANGVRDDIERLLAGTTRPQVFSGTTLSIARDYQRLTTLDLTASDVAAAYKRIECSDRTRTANDRLVMSTETIRDLTANTSARRRTIVANDTKLRSAASAAEGDASC